MIEMLQRKFHFSFYFRDHSLSCQFFIIVQHLTKNMWRATTQQIKMINLKSLKSFMKHENNSFKAHHASIIFFLFWGLRNKVSSICPTFIMKKLWNNYIPHIFAYKFIFMLFLFFWKIPVYYLFIWSGLHE